MFDAESGFILEPFHVWVVFLIDSPYICSRKFIPSRTVIPATVEKVMEGVF